MSTNYEEMEEIARGNKEREAVVAFVKRLGVDKMFIDESLKREYERVDAELAKKEAKEQGYEQGIEQGIEQGKKENTIDIVKAMYEKGINIEDIAQIVKIDIEEVKQILKTDN